MPSLLCVNSPIGPLTLREENGALISVERVYTPSGGDKTELLCTAAQQLTEYFSGARQAFDLPLSPAGTVFQQAVWRELRAIPYGETRSYGEIAAAISRPKACRAVGMANHRNPLLIVVPCHRVIGADGSLTGYGAGLDVKAYLLDLERRFRG